MKNLHYIKQYFIITFFFPLFLNAQQPSGNPDLFKMMTAPNADFNQICNTLDSYYSANPDANEGGGFRQYQVWKEFWKTRVGEINSTYTNSFQHAYDALTTIIVDPVCNTSASMPANWSLLGPITQTGPGTIPDMGIIVSLAVDPVNNNIIYAGSSNSGLWKSTDITLSNITWTNLTDGLNLPGLGINYIAIDPNDHDKIYIATGETRGAGSGYGIGILRTTDGGSNWTTLGPGNPAPYNVARKIIIDHPTANTTVIYIIIKDAVYKSVNDGDDWLDQSGNPGPVFQLPNSTGQAPFGGIARNCFDIVILPSNHNVLFVSSDDAPATVTKGQCPLCYPTCGCTGNNGSLLYRTNDAFQTPPVPVFIETPNGSMADFIRLSVTSQAGYDNLVYAAYVPFLNIDCPSCTVLPPIAPKIVLIDASGNNQATRTALNMNIDNVYNTFAIAPDDATIMYCSGYWLSKSTDGGDNFNIYSTNHHVDVRAVLALPNNKIIIGNDGGVSISYNGGISWSNINGTGLAITQFYGIGASQTKPHMFSGGSLDNDVFIYDNGWIMPPNPNPLCLGVLPCQDGADVVIDRNNSNNVYAQNWCCGSTAVQIYKYFFNGTAWISQGNIQPGCPNNCLPANAVRPMLMHPNNYLYTGYEEVYKAPVSTYAWTKISNFQRGFIDYLDVAPSNPNIIYAGFDGETWSTYSSTDPNRAKKLFKTTIGGGLGPNDWEDLTDELNSSFDGHWFPEAFSITKVLVHPEKPDIVWVTFSGFANTGISPPYWGKNRVYMSTNGGSTWTDYSNGLTEFPINSIAYERGSNDGLYVGTDVGVFYRNASLNQWECFNDNFPTSIVTDLDINYASNTIGAGTFGRGIWESPLACPINTYLNFTYSNSSALSGTFQEAENDITLTADAGNINLTDLTLRAGNEIVISAQGTNEVNIGPNSDLFIHACNHPGNSFKRLQNNNDNHNSEQQKSIQKNELNFSLYPNPTNNTFTLQMETEDAASKNISVFSTIGKEIFHLEKLITANTVIDLSSNPKGIYFVKVTQDGKQSVKKIIFM